MNINLMVPINDLGYGVAGFNILRELIQRNHEVALFPLGPVIADQKYGDMLTKAWQLQDYFDYKAPSIRIFHQNKLAESIGKGQRIGFPIFELNKFTDTEKNHLSSCDKLLVCSRWAKTVIEENGIRVPTFVVPLGVDREIFKPVNTQQWPETRFINIGKWEDRKGHDILGEAFCRAFTAEDNVKLMMHCFNPFLKPEQAKVWENLYANTHMGDKISASVNRGGPHAVVADLLNQVDCAVFPSKAEGWNLELLEAMSCGKHCIATFYSGHTEFINPNNCHLIDINEKELAFDTYGWFKGQGEWAKIGEPQIEQLIQYMRKIHELKQNNKLPTNHVGIETAQQFSWQNTVSKLLEAIDV